MKLWIDAGHGFGNVQTGKYDPGAVSNGLTEADLALTVALSGRWILNTEFNIETWLTRDDDSDASPVGTRDNRAMEAGCTHGISLHMNSSTSARATGTEVFYRTAQDAVLARAAKQAALTAFGLRDRGLKIESQSQHSSLAVMDFVPPNCLLELGFITNSGDAKRILDRDRRIQFWRHVGVSLVQLTK
jgi:N-acetylmuramoyl-L-alanine amidase